MEKRPRRPSGLSQLTFRVLIVGRDSDPVEYAVTFRDVDGIGVPSYTVNLIHPRGTATSVGTGLTGVSFENSNRKVSKPPETVVMISRITGLGFLNLLQQPAW